MTPLPPGSTIGILGGGQLGRMLAVAAAQLGYRTHVLAPDAESVAAQTASSFTRADYHSRIVLDELAASCDVVTYEFENIALDPVEYLAGKVPVHPAPQALGIAQDRALEKQFVNDLGGRTAPWRKVTSREELEAALAAIGTPAAMRPMIGIETDPPSSSSLPATCNLAGSFSVGRPRPPWITPGENFLAAFSPGAMESGSLTISIARARLGRRRMKPRSSSAVIRRWMPDFEARSSASFISSKDGGMPVSFNRSWMKRRSSCCLRVNIGGPQ